LAHYGPPSTETLTIETTTVWCHKNNNNNAFVERHNAVAPEVLAEQVASCKQCRTNKFLA